MAKAITREEAQERLAKFVEAQGLGASDLDNYGTNAEFTQGIWGDEAQVYIRLDWDGKVDVKVNWSSTHRTPAMARAALENYTKAVVLAERIQAFADCLPPVETMIERAERERESHIAMASEEQA